MKNSALKTILPVLVIVSGFALVFLLGGRLDKSRPAPPEGYEDQDLALQGARLKGYTLGFDGLIADWYWMQSLQYVGKKILNSQEEKISLDDLNNLNPRLLYPYLDNATTLDPKFYVAYAYGAVVLPAIDKDQAIKIARKGIANNPDNWRLYQHLGFIYWKTKDYKAAAETYEKGMILPGAPPFMKIMAANMRADGESRQTARAMYRQMIQNAEDSQTKKAVEQRLMTLDSLDEREAVNPILKEFQRKNGRCAQSWSEILPLLKNVKLPDGLEFRLDQSNNLIDPSGAPYILDKAECDIKLNLEKTNIIPIGK